MAISGPFNAHIEAERLHGSRGGFPLFADVSFSLKPGAALRVTGPNGSGKSTLLRMLAGLIRPDAGKVTITGHAPDAAPGETIHYLGHLNAMKPQLTVAENLDFWLRFSGGAAAEGGWEDALRRVGLSRVRDLAFADLSAGQKRRVAIARLLATPRAIWLVDEPTAGLDAASTVLFETLIAEQLAQGGIVIGATHVPLGRDEGWQTLAIDPATVREPVAREALAP
ncbi:MAG: heme ABC exporter ATP-binding protein CcmA [Rhizobiaceae bacterium]|nr:heme ABC exporter ATP-binding protein CcmA [Rhizobiaceae bacterium]